MVVTNQRAIKIMGTTTTKTRDMDIAQKIYIQTIEIHMGMQTWTHPHQVIIIRNHSQQ